MSLDTKHDVAAEPPPAKRRRLSGAADESNHPQNTMENHTVSSLTTAVSGTPNTDDDNQLDKEIRCGIISFVDPLAPGFTGVLKQRYTDFLVNEVLPNGEVLHLRNLAPVKVQRQEQKSGKTKNEMAESSDAQNGQHLGQVKREDENQPPVTEVSAVMAEVENAEQDSGTNKAKEKAVVEADSALASEGSVIPAEDKTSLEGVFGSEVVIQIISLYQSILKHPERKPNEHRPVISKELLDKDIRTQAHQTVRKSFSAKLETTFIEDDNTIRITAAAAAGKARGGGRNDGPKPKNKLGWDELGGDHLHFTLYKENKDTMEAIFFLASQLKVSVKSFQFGGTKDRRGVTVQRASAYRVRAEQLAQIGKRLRGSRVGDFLYCPNGLELGELGGNEFVITLRDCHFPGEEGLNIKQRVKLAEKILARGIDSFESNGFINYYGLQRFGSFTTGTDAIGTKLLQGNLKGAIEDILQYNPTALLNFSDSNSTNDANLLISSDDRARATAIHTWETTQNANLALSQLPRKFSAESNIIRHLGVRDHRTKSLNRINDYQGALQTIPRNLRLMYVHAYQSLVWNAVAGARWEKYGHGVVAGDLVLVDAQRDGGEERQAEVDEEGEPIVLPAEHDTAAPTFERARPLSAAEATSGKFTIFDVVLPLPGYDVEYPANDIAEVYKTFMASERGGGLDPYDMRRSWKDMSLSGGYRKLLSKPGEGLEAEIRVYESAEEQLVETDLERLAKASGRKGNGEVDEKQENGEAIKDSDDDDAKKIAVVVRMRLGPSQYATMALRELMKKGGVRTYKPDYGGGR